ncbi:MAG: bifunctional 4-hydroxy-3-methylbut-2-enyl diphosphate reductase/30S ribosomal protein S1 [Ruminococcaceae bacterium]|nr:bifunctional 4-hydroxy-3-methylbut-2-enyl diphosphate reductase/30S ribosomal protein S1 [Oscillospiraceae bacterium]
MKITIAKTAGFCFGVNRAVDMVWSTVENGKKCVTYGPIIHNRHVVNRFAEHGVFELDGEPQPGTAVILRSHGVSADVYKRLEELGVEYVDATCPFVARIHSIVKDAENRGRLPVIIGTRTHPEVQAIAGHCKSSIVFQSSDEIEEYAESNPIDPETPITVVSQTTNTKNKFNSCIEILKKLYTNPEIFDTICSATENRQTEAMALAASCDAMIVIGDTGSSNTKRLAEIAAENCPITQFIDNADELDLSLFKNCNTVGITAGASTPQWIIKEVYTKMSEELKIQESAEEVVEAVETAPAAEENSVEEEESFEALLDKSFKTLRSGEKVTGIVTAISQSEISVDLGAKQSGYIPVAEFSDDPTAKVEDLFKIGEEVEAYILRVNDVEGTVMLSKKRLDSVKSWDDIETAREERTVIEAVVTEENKGGVVANVRGIRVFVPASQTGLAKDAPMSDLLKQKVRLRITEVNKARRRVVGSIRAVQYEERKAAAEQVWAEIEEGKKYQGTVKSLTSYGAFVDIGGVDGMVHVSELSWNRIKNPAEVVSVGDSIEVYVISFDTEKKKISLGYKTAETNPWNIFVNNYQIGDVADVKIVKLMTFGAFAEVVPGVDGLIHISQIADRRIGKPGDVLTEGETVQAKIIDIDLEKQKISLSIRALLQDEAEANVGEEDEIVASTEDYVEEAPAEEEAE